MFRSAVNVGMLVGMSGEQCDGCLGGGDCWVCLGHGLLDVARGGLVPCHRCYATGRCTLCQQVTLGDIGAALSVTV